MQTGRSLLKVAVIIAVTAPLASCGFFAELTAMRTFKDANMLYGRADYTAAIEEYEQVIEVLGQNPDSELAQVMTAAYFYIGNSYDNLYKPALRGDVENDAYLDQAVEYYGLGSERSADPGLQKLSMQYLVAAFGADKKNDPASSEPILRAMIQLDPADPDNYFALARLYEEAGLYEDAEIVMIEVRNMRPEDPTVYLQLAGFYNRAGDFERTIEALQQRAAIEPDNPEAYYTISTYYWEKAFRDFRITQEEKADYITAGLDAADQAIGLNDRYVDALVYKNILLRMQANMTEDLGEREALIAEADELRDRAQALQEEARGGGGASS
jgi:tetratricopeptide (TPR) repeat protein